MEFSKILKEKRKELGFTQEELAEKLMVSRSAISNWEIGRNYPDIQTLIAIAKTFDVSLDHLLNQDIEIVKALNFDTVKKRKSKKMIIILSIFLIFTTITTIYLFLNKKSEIVLLKENIPTNTEITPFKKDEIKNVNIEDNKLNIVLDTPTQILGYYLEFSDRELTVNLYKKDDKEVKKGMPFEGFIKIDLKEYSKIKKIIVNYE